MSALALFMAIHLTALAGQSPQAAVARGMLQNGRYRRAIGVFRQLLEKEPGKPAYELGLGRGLAGINQCDAALPYLERHVDAPAFGARDALAAADCALALGDRARAALYVEDALYFEPDDAELLFEVGWTAAQVDEPALFGTALDRFEEAGGSLGRQAVLLARWRLAQGDTQGAWDELQQARDYDFYGRYAAMVDARAWLLVDEPAIAVDLLREWKREDLEDMELACWLAEAHRRSGVPGLGGLILNAKRRADRDAVCRDVVLVRLGADRDRPGYLDEAHDLLARFPVLPEVVASAWYAARASGHTAEASSLATRYGEVARPEDGPLDLLIPIDARHP